MGKDWDTLLLCVPQTEKIVQNLTDKRSFDKTVNKL